MFKYHISLLLILTSLVSFAQEKEEKESSWKNPNRQIFIRLGVDMAKFIEPLLTDVDLMGYGFSIDGELKAKFYPTYEFGYNAINDVTLEHDYQMSGFYHKLGLDYNLLKLKHRLDRNMFYLGLRVATSNFSHQASRISLENEFGTGNYSFDERSYHAYWGEFILGLRGEIFKNFYMGYTVRFKQKFNNFTYGDISPEVVPGYGSGAERSKFGMTYSLFYAIPIKEPKPQNTFGF